MSSGSPSKPQMLSFFDVLHTPTVLSITLPFHFPKLYLASNHFLAEGRAGTQSEKVVYDVQLKI